MRYADEPSTAGWVGSMNKATGALRPWGTQRKKGAAAPVKQISFAQTLGPPAMDTRWFQLVCVCSLWDPPTNLLTLKHKEEAGKVNQDT